MKRKILVLILVLIVFALIIIIPSPSSTMSSTPTYTREELQDYIVSTAVSYYYNNKYTDYDGYWADESHSDYSTIYTLSPEMISRSKYMTTQCEAFATTCYMHALNFNFLKYRDLLSNGRYTGYIKSTSGNLSRVYASSSDAAFVNANKYFNKVYDVGYMNKIARKRLDDPMVVLTYQKGLVSTIEGVTDTSKTVTELLTGPGGDEILNKITSKLQPGDIILNDGHAMVWVGSVFEPQGGVIHSSAVTSSMKRDENDDKVITEFKNGYDAFDVKYTSAYYMFRKNIVYHGSNTNDDITILRPINSMCTFSNGRCTLDSKYASVVSNAIARSKLKNLRVEQYMYDKTGDRTLGADSASVNVGDEITYTLALTNKSNFGFCTSGKKSNKDDCINSFTCTKSDKTTQAQCEQKGGEWAVSTGICSYETKASCEGNGGVWTSNSGVCSNATINNKYDCESKNNTWTPNSWINANTSEDFSGITITATVPSNTKYVSCTKSCKQSNGTITWSNVSIAKTNTSENKYSFTVKVSDGASKVSFAGMKLKYKDSTLEMGTFKTLVNSTINGKYATEFKKIIDNDISKGTSCSSSLDYILKTYKTYLNNSNDESRPVHSDVTTNLSDIITSQNIMDSVFKEITFENLTSYTKKPSGEANALTGNNKILNQMLIPGFWGGYRFNKLYYNSNMSYHQKVKPMWTTRINLNVGDIIVSLDKNKSTNKFSIKNVMVYDGMDGSNPVFVYCENGNIIKHKKRSFAKTDIRSKFYTNWYGNTLLIYEMYSSDLYVALRPSMYYNLQYNVAVTSIKLDKTSVALGEGDSFTSIATISPSNATNKSVTWTSSNSNVATVDSNGKITGVKEGTATITAKTTNGKTATCNVTVNKKEVAPTMYEVTGVTLNQTTKTIKEGESFTLTATISPSNATNKAVTWTSSNSSVATVSNGKVTGVKEGRAVITVSSTNGKTATCSVIVLSSAGTSTPIDTEIAEPIEDPTPIIPVNPPVETQQTEHDETQEKVVSPETDESDDSHENKANEFEQTTEVATPADVAIKDIKIDFDKEVYDYKVKTDKDSLDFNIALDNETDTYEIIGNENLKDGSVVTVKVTSESGEEKEYHFKIINNKKYYVLGVIGGIAILITTIIVVIKRKKNYIAPIN